jgi:TonB-dependent SusC/RagA subfamily outer membrane receptor
MKNTRSQLILSVFLSFALLSFANGQQKAIKERADQLNETGDITTIKGTVTAFKNYYVKNTEVTSRKTRSNAVTDSLGMFEIMAANGDVLIFRANGFEKNRRKLSANENNITVDMILVPGEKNEKKAVAYGHMHEKDLAYALEHYNIINNDFSAYNDMRELLQAALLGTRVTDQGGSVRVYIRGRDISSVGLSENNGAAQFAVDGMIVRDVDFLNPRDVKNIRLLTGHEATRIYGSHGANGVVMIRTK